MNCRSCGCSSVQPFISLGKTPLANALVTEEHLLAPEAKYVLEVVFCTNCTLVQLVETVPPENLFSDYVYFSSFSSSMVEHARCLSDRLIQERKLGQDSVVLEIASNDGYLLQWYQNKGIPVLGIEPAKNIACVAREKRNIRTLEEFFGADLAGKLKYEGIQADVVHAHNVMAHVPDINGFVFGLNQILKPNGIAVIEVPYVVDMIEKCEFDTIYHEHVFYFSVTALNKLLQRHDLLLERVERIPIHGGSLRLFVVPMISGMVQDKSVLNLLEQEKKLDYLGFEQKVQNLKENLVSFLSNLKKSGKTIAAYGASAKGSTLLNYFRIGKDIIDFVVDRSLYKQGKYMPGIHIPIFSPEGLLKYKPDYTLLLTWNFQGEILSEQAEYRAQGGRFIVPLPSVYEI